MYAEKDDSRITPEAQVSSANWTPPGGVLGLIMAESRERARALTGARRTELERAAAAAPPPPSFTKALRAGATIAVIAEVKRRSPSQGEINAALSAGAQATAYAAGGAAAISVLTEPTHFGGSMDDLAEVWKAVAIPLLRKDFVIDRTQLWEARAGGGCGGAPDRPGAGAGAAAMRSPRRPGRSASSRSWKCAPRAELARALAAGAEVVGVNKRDLETLAVDPAVTARLLPPRAG